METKTDARYAPVFTGELDDWADWRFAFTAYAHTRGLDIPTAGTDEIKGNFTNRVTAPTSICECGRRHDVINKPLDPDCHGCHGLPSLQTLGLTDNRMGDQPRRADSCGAP